MNQQVIVGLIILLGVGLTLAKLERQDVIATYRPATILGNLWVNASFNHIVQRYTAFAI